MDIQRGDSDFVQPGHESQYAGPKDVGRADSLYESALTKPDPEYCIQLLFWALVANPEHERAFATILDKISGLGPVRKRLPSRVATMLTGSAADEFVRSLGAYCANNTAEQGIECGTDARKIGLFRHAAILGQRVLSQLESRESAIKIPGALKLIEVLEESGAYDTAVRAMAFALNTFPNAAELKEREKNLLARKYLKEQARTADFRENLQDRAAQETAQRAANPSIRLEELEHHYQQTHRPEDFKEFARAVREAPAERREGALATMQEAYERFGEKEILWFIREIKLQRRWSEVRLHQRAAAEHPNDSQLRQDYERVRRTVLSEEVDHLYEVVSALPPGPDRHKREMLLSQKLLQAERFEEAIKQAQAIKRRAESRVDAWVVMAKAFVQLDLTIEAEACFVNILKELSTDPSDAGARALDAKYSYAEFLLQEAEKKKSPDLARQARKICADIMLDDIDYRDIRKLSSRAENFAH